MGRQIRWGSILVSIVALLVAAPAFAGGNGSQGQTLHAHGAAAYDLLVADFLPANGSPSLPDGCWMPSTDALMSTFGNAILHSTANKADDFWFTSTYTGDAAVYPIVFIAPGVPLTDENDNDVLDTSGQPLATGHLTTWFGISDNKQNEVDHATLTFTGTDVNGNAVSISGHFQLATNANGDVTATPTNISCSG